MIIYCSDCANKIIINYRPVIGEIVNCDMCGLEMEVVKVKGNKITVKEFYIEGEDWGE